MAPNVDPKSLAADRRVRPPLPLVTRNVLLMTAMKTDRRSSSLGIDLELDAQTVRPDVPEIEASHRRQAPD